MGMTIDEAIKHLTSGCNYNYEGKAEEFCEAYDMAIDTMHKYQMMQADYNSRLKADMVAMLTDIQLEIEEHKTDYDKDSKSEHDIYYAYDRCSGIVQSKINSLRGNNDA